MDRALDNKANCEAILPWDNFKKWFYALIVVKFDLELGQAIELVYPQSLKLTEKEKMNICFLSFPDSNSACIGDTVYHFRLPITISHRKSLSLFTNLNSECLIRNEMSDNFYNGYVYFRQVKDANYQRGYFQKSLLLLTKYPLHNLFYYIVQEIAPMYFDSGLPTLETSCHDIDQWPSPMSGTILNLPFMGKIFKCRIPKNEDLLSNTHLLDLYRSEALTPNESNCNNIFIPNLFDMDLYSCLLPIITQVHLLWELVITCEPILVIGSNPSVCSSIVEALVSIIWPLKYASDYRPYFTIHDQDFKKYVQKDISPSVILGVTNPFFAKSLQHWPHIIRVDHLSRKSHKHSKLKKTTMQPFDTKTGVYTKTKSFIRKDKIFLERLIKSQKRPAEVQNAMLRRYFTELTQSFMIPLERYIACLLPLFDEISPYKKWPKLGQFDQEEFIKSLKQSGPQLTTHLKGDWEGLYRQFIKSPMFESWCSVRMFEMSRKVALILSQKIQIVNFEALYKPKSEMEIVDIIITLRDKLKYYRTSDQSAFHSVIVYLDQQIMKLTQCLPQDLRISL